MWSNYWRILLKNLQNYLVIIGKIKVVFLARELSLGDDGFGLLSFRDQKLISKKENIK